jgi:hypothetical protein
MTSQTPGMTTQDLVFMWKYGETSLSFAMNEKSPGQHRPGEAWSLVSPLVCQAVGQLEATWFIKTAVYHCLEAA